MQKIRLKTKIWHFHHKRINDQFFAGGIFKQFKFRRTIYSFRMFYIILDSNTENAAVFKT